jgi:acylphosphatase
MSGPEKRLRAIVRGRVQGVGYRYFVQMAAIGLHLDGRVANLPDGSVEVVAEGSRDALEQFISALWQGPRSARVEAVEEHWSEPTGEFGEFAVVSSL